MTITARSITTNNTLEQLRNQFNNLVSDVDGLETGTKAFSTITATDTNTTTLNVLEDGTIVFEGATDDAFETTLTVADPTADRTITLPDSTGTVVVSGTGGFTVSDGGNIGSDSDPDAISISSAGVVAFSATTANTNASDGAVTIAGGVGIAADLSVGDDLRLISDSAVLSFGADSDTTLTHTDGSGLTINSTNKIMFRDSALFINSSTDGQLDIDADTEVEITATTIDINGAVEISGTTTQTGVSTSAAKDIFNASLSVKNGSTSAGFIEFFEDSDNGTNKVTLIGPASTSDVTLTLGTATGTIATTDDATALAIALG